MNIDRFNSVCEAAQSISNAACELKHLDAPARILALLDELEAELTDFVNYLESEDHPSLSAAQRNSIN
jgi:hypothetical protein